MATPGTKRQKVETDVEMQECDQAKPETSEPQYSVQELMKLYYGRLFPYQQFHRWLVYGNDSKRPQADQVFFQKRELCFTLDGDIFCRYQSFKDCQDMEEAIKARCPAKIDIGPVYTANPQDRAKYAGQFTTVERELVFDIDLTDYDDVRTCGKEGHICSKCWPLMALAVQILDVGLREDFGFQHILWVYSGRRGVHCWVCDPSARTLTDEQRSAVASYFNLYRGTEGKQKAKLSLSTFMPPSVERAKDVLEEAWLKHVLPCQRLLEDPDMQAAMLRYLPDEELVERVKSAWAAGGGRRRDEDVNVQRWNVLVEEVNRRLSAEKNNKTALRYALERCVNQIMFAFSYPRLDMEVSKKMNHLLKAPFCVHPKTGKVCVPFTAEEAWSFDPDGVPTLNSLIKQLDEAGQGCKGSDWKLTDLSHSVEMFESEFLEPLHRTNMEQLAARARDAAAKPSFAW